MTASNVPVLSLQGLMSPRPNARDQSLSPIPMEVMASTDTLFVSNLLPQLQGITVQKEDVIDHGSDDISMGSGHRLSMGGGRLSMGGQGGPHFVDRDDQK